MTASDAYAELVRRSKELGVLNSCAAVLGWDHQTYMPAKGGALRGEQMAFLASLSHQKFTDPKVGELLAAVEASDLVREPESDGAANTRELRAGVRSRHQDSRNRLSKNWLASPRRRSKCGNKPRRRTTTPASGHRSRRLWS